MSGEKRCKNVSFSKKPRTRRPERHQRELGRPGVDEHLVGVPRGQCVLGRREQRDHGRGHIESDDVEARLGLLIDCFCFVFCFFSCVWLFVFRNESLDIGERYLFFAPEGRIGATREREREKKRRKEELILARRRRDGLKKERGEKKTNRPLVLRRHACFFLSRGRCCCLEEEERVSEREGGKSA